MISRPLAACIVIALGSRAYAQRAEADAEFQRGRTLLARGEVAEACAAFEASMRLDPEKGTLYNLGLCHERLGKLASAWSELDELARTDTNAARGADAGKHAAALLPRLTRMHLTVEGKPEGLLVMRDKVDVTALVGKDAPVDPGMYTFVATARDREPVTLEVDLTAEGKTIDVTVPEARVKGVDASEFPIELPRRPILIPKGMGEVSVFPSILMDPDFDRTAIDTGVFARTRVGPFEVSATLGFLVRTKFKMNKPNPWDTIGIGVRYPIEPGLVVGINYAEVQPLRDDLRGSDIAANVERKLLVYPNVAVDGLAGVVLSQRANGDDAFVLVGEGRAQFSVAGALSLEAFAGLDLNVLGDLYPYTVGLTVAALALYAIEPNIDVFAQAANDLLPDSNLHVYTFGASWRTR